MATVKEILTDSGATVALVAEHLEALPSDSQWEELAVLGRSEQRRLFEIADRRITLPHFVPEDRDPGVPVVHRGRNTLPLPRKHRFFEKRFCRPRDGSERLFGYNEAPSRGLVGPGYFVAVPTAGNAEWEPRGAVVVDYFRVPDGPVAEGWPSVVPNSKGLQRFVYHHTRDFMRRVSARVSIGAAYKGEKSLDHYFVLLRQDS